MATRNLTLTLDEELMVELERIAVRRGVPVNAIVEREIADLVSSQRTPRRLSFEQARDRALESLRTGLYSSPPGWAFNRDEIYDQP